MTISILALKGKLNGKILLLRFFFYWVYIEYGCLCPYVKVFSRDMTSDKPLHVLKEINFARFSLKQSLSEYFPFKT